MMESRSFRIKISDLCLLSNKSKALYRSNNRDCSLHAHPFKSYNLICNNLICIYYKNSWVYLPTLNRYYLKQRNTVPWTQKCYLILKTTPWITVINSFIKFFLKVDIIAGQTFFPIFLTRVLFMLILIRMRAIHNADPTVCGSDT